MDKFLYVYLILPTIHFPKGKYEMHFEMVMATITVDIIIAKIAR